VNGKVLQRSEYQQYIEKNAIRVEKYAIVSRSKRKGIIESFIPAPASLQLVAYPIDTTQISKPFKKFRESETLKTTLY
jgi:hypothetical protein